MARVLQLLGEHTRYYKPTAQWVQASVETRASQLAHADHVRLQRKMGGLVLPEQCACNCE